MLQIPSLLLKQLSIQGFVDGLNMVILYQVIIIWFERQNSIIHEVQNKAHERLEIESKISSVESQKGAITITRCSVENQNQTLYSDSPLLTVNGTSLNIDSALLVLNGTSSNTESALLALNGISLNIDSAFLVLNRYSEMFCWEPEGHYQTSLNTDSALLALNGTSSNTDSALLALNRISLNIDSAFLVLNRTSLNTDSALLALNRTSLNTDSALLALNWQYAMLTGMGWSIANQGIQREVGLDVAGTKHRDLDVMVHQLGSERIKEGLHGMFGSRICKWKWMT